MKDLLLLRMIESGAQILIEVIQISEDRYRCLGSHVGNSSKSNRWPGASDQNMIDI
jgi:hypothetical protein